MLVIVILLIMTSDTSLVVVSLLKWCCGCERNLLVSDNDRGPRSIICDNEKISIKEGLFSLTFTNFKVDSPGIMNSEF